MGGGGGVGGDIYWGRKEETESRGITVIFAWASIQERHLKSYIDLYASLGWNCLVCHADFLNAFYPEKAMSLAFLVINELVEELRIRPCPIIFVALSGSPKACMYKIFQVIDGTCGERYPGEYQLIRNCVSGHIYDSSPVDLTSDLGARFTLHPSLRRMPGSSKIFSWLAKGITSGLDALYLTRFESQCVEYWQALYSSVNFSAPFLIICSEKDDLAPYQMICNFAQHLQDLGGDVKLVKLNGSPHMGHYKHNPIQYRAAVSSMLDQAALVYSQKIRLLGERTSMEGMHDEISELICDLQNAAVTSNQSLTRVALGPSDHFFLPSSAEHHYGRDSPSLQDEQKERSISLPNPSSINAHSVLGQILFDVCVPKNVEGWDIKFGGSLNGQPFASVCRPSPFHGIKCIRRSRL
ncbi:hypothetical protein I3843_06G136400 [Carya illinoinensis]|uniref:Uncharacterized protein n=1 Tax=Carya illinoinensis TaxID=32201 RepID=A0A8T1QBJ5_CARIL|nr:uncharacterized protein LOC122312426 isoform X1 [Carya illinoinensis]KAG6651866.1 hypothetical protein CIPAW_06G143000 [Carya illinoinensis]KAG6709648.1 hypothetical protein I3842_06G143600 [Carya illinoinensis]KAG7976168.1 hypothetical protein I3843_06G136400 [Carya illinoinensis]